MNIHTHTHTHTHTYIYISYHKFRKIFPYVIVILFTFKSSIP